MQVACEDLKRKLAQEKRDKWRQEAHHEYAKSNSEYMWESIDGEDLNDLKHLLSEWESSEDEKAYKNL